MSLDENEEESHERTEFGKGLTYCLGLFLAHQDRDLQLSIQSERKYNRGAYWFNGASDHLYDLQIPTNLPEALQERLKKFRHEMLNKGHGDGLMEDHSEKEIREAIAEAKALLREIDSFFGVTVEQGRYE